MIKSIQLLRALAAVAVVFRHYKFHDLDTGGFGVDIFFVISGFIIAYMVTKTTDKFMWKRVIRLVPLYFIATLLTVVLALIKPMWFKTVYISVEGVVKSLLFIPYLKNGSGPILSLGWTLNNEMFFYLVMFLCILLIPKKKYLVLACAGVLTLFLIILHSFNTDSYILNFYKKGLLVEFIFGLLLFYFWTYYKSKITTAGTVIFTLIGIASFVFMIYSDLTGVGKFLGRNVVRGVPAVLLVNALLVLEDKININNIFVKWGIRLGDASYAMYLFHPFIVFFFIRLVFPFAIGTTHNFLIQFIELLITLTAVCLGSIIIYELLDKPIINKLRKIIK